MSKIRTKFKNWSRFLIFTCFATTFCPYPDLFAPKKVQVTKKARRLRKKNRIATFLKKNWQETAIAGGIIVGVCLTFYCQFHQSPTIFGYKSDSKPVIRPAKPGEVGKFGSKGPAIGGFLKGGLFSGLTTSQSPGAQLFTGIRNRTPGDDEIISIKPDDKGLLGSGRPTIKVKTLRDIQKSSIVVVDGKLMTPNHFKEKVGKLEEAETEGTVCHGQYCFSFVKQAGITDDDNGEACYELKDGPIDEDPTGTTAINPFVMLSMSGFSQTKTQDISLDRTQSLWRTVLATAKAMNVSKISSPALGMGAYNKGAQATELYFDGLCQELQKPEFTQITEFRINPAGKTNHEILQKVLAKPENISIKDKVKSVQSDSLLLAETLAQQETGERWALINPSNGNVTAGTQVIGNIFLVDIGQAEEFFTAMTTASICSYPKDPKDIFLKSEKWEQPISVDQALATE